MSFLSWLFGKGIAGAISSDLVEKYLGIKSQHPHEEDEEILERVWNFWLTLNADKIQTEDGEDKIARLNIIKEKNDKKTAIDSLTALKSLFNLYQDILYIETEITTSDGKIWDNSMKVFIKESRKYGLDFIKEYESLKRMKDGLK
jgi:hypothetical protein